MTKFAHSFSNRFKVGLESFGSNLIVYLFAWLVLGTFCLTFVPSLLVGILAFGGDWLQYVVPVTVLSSVLSAPGFLSAFLLGRAKAYVLDEIGFFYLAGGLLGGAFASLLLILARWTSFIISFIGIEWNITPIHSAIWWILPISAIVCIYAPIHVLMDDYHRVKSLSLKNKG
ncbi:MAG TPA: hypothetical protein VFI61_01885 [Patescibacteria group bacterium]|nr:hypothetical protein [Patescibacteria group bacterium]